MDLGTIIGAVNAGSGLISAIGGLFGKKKASKQAEYFATHAKTIAAADARRAAEAYGFSPLTMLGVGGAVNPYVDAGGSGWGGFAGFQQGLAALQDAVTTDDAEEKQKKQAERDLERVVKEQKKADDQAVSEPLIDLREGLPGQWVAKRPGMYERNWALENMVVRDVAGRPRMAPWRPGGDLEMVQKRNLTGGTVFIPKDAQPFEQSQIATAGQWEEYAGSGPGEMYGAAAGLGNTADRVTLANMSYKDAKMKPAEDWTPPDDATTLEKREGNPDEIRRYLEGM